MAGAPDRLSAEANPFWEFSLSLYGQTGVAEACLRLQDRDAADVNLLLYCCWAATQGRTLSPADQSRLESAIADWTRNVIWPLRACRRWLKTGTAAETVAAETMAADLRALELKAERVAQDLLVVTLPTGPELPLPGSARTIALARANLDLYLRHIGETDGAAAADRETILDGLKQT